MTAAIILAGGLGTRLREVVSHVPKPLAPINGRPFLEYQLDYWIEQGVIAFVISVGYMHQHIIGHFGDEYRGVPIDYSVESTPLGTGGAFLLAAQYIFGDEPFLLLNGDTFFEVDLSALQRFHCKKNADWTFSMFRADRSGRYMGVEVDSNNRIVEFYSQQSEERALVNGGVYYISPKAVAHEHWQVGDKGSLESDLVPAALESGADFYAFECSGKFIDIGVPADYVRAASLLGSRSVDM